MLVFVFCKSPLGICLFCLLALRSAKAFFFMRGRRTYLSLDVLWPVSPQWTADSEDRRPSLDRLAKTSTWPGKRIKGYFFSTLHDQAWFLLYWFVHNVIQVNDWRYQNLAIAGDWKAAIDDSKEFETFNFRRKKTQNEWLVRCVGGGVWMLYRAREPYTTESYPGFQCRM